jgi:23S rRNA (cytidine1920-2'-O)/16S rRNA (cytidine1409-2'-O)-methyltransferase
MSRPHPQIPAQAAKRRADQLLVERGLAESRAKAQALILAGVVNCDGRRIDKPGEQLAADAALSVKGNDHPWVSRGGLKLAHALDYFGIAVEGKTALDIGASTGGFTDVLLSRGAGRVYAVDVGHGQLAWKLRQDRRVIVHERVNARYLTRAQVPEPIEMITCDASFIGLATVLPAPLALAAEEAKLVALVKPQFEAGREHVGKGGVVRDPAVHHEVCERAAAWVAAQPGWTVVGVVESPVLGPQGNREFLLYARRSGAGEEAPMGPHSARPEDRLRGDLEGRTIVLQRIYSQAAVSPRRCAVFHTRQ